MPEKAARHDSDVTRKTSIALLLAGLALYVLVGVHFLNFAPDDVYITLRYAANVAAGQGPVYNVGERVEGYSNPLFLALLALLQPLLASPRNMVLAAKLIGLIAGLLAVAAAAALARRDPEGSPYWGLAPLLVGLGGYLAFWSASGLETGLHALLVVVAVGGYIRALETGRCAWRALCGLLFALVALSRPEGAVFLVAAVIARALLLLRDRRGPDAADGAFLVLAIAPIVAHFVWRHSYYGVWWPNTFYAKAGGGWSTWTDGARYLLLAVGPACWGSAILLPVLALGLAPWRKATPRTLVLWLAVLAQAGFIIVAGGDWMPGWRFIAPVAPLLALLAPGAVARLLDVLHRRRLVEQFGGWIKWLPLALIILVMASHLYSVKQLSHQPSGWRGLDDAQMFAAPYKRAADWLAQQARPGDWLATGEAGLIPYLTGLPTIDCFGLTDAHLARVPGKRHEKVDPDYILGRKPRFLLIGGAHPGVDGPTSDFAYGRSLLVRASDYQVVYQRDSFVILERRANVAN